eukprot:TRINITY_DN5655_c0_g1_i12.p6 TRINITY_DN5655_c0_g1~~TRINITY_DN5655_c0_g1_i12.p6  ORF type:complete len:181 (-),score=13.75 TRINITY_DN5655_c0_g1_i12:2713-3255(-)
MYEIKESTFFILSGSMDVVNSRPEQIYDDLLPQQITDAVTSSVDLLLENGAQDIKIVNIPPLYLTPLILGRPVEFQQDSRQLVRDINFLFQQVFCSEKYSNNVKLVDFESMVTEVIIKAQDMGYEIYNPLNQNSNESMNFGDGPQFWIDAIHPDVIGHELLADKLQTVLFNSESAYDACV